MTKSRVVFCGTPEFARVSLAALLDAGVRPVAVYTQPDRPKGRGRKLLPCPVKQCAAEAGLPVHQPASLRKAEARAELAALRPDLIIVAAYGLIFPQSVLDIPPQGCLNVHASLLPRWRGAAPIQAAILAGDTVSGISLMQMEAGLDSGPVFATREVPIAPQMSAGELHDQLAVAGGELLVACLPDIVDGRLAAKAQDAALMTHAGKITTADSVLDWRLPAAHLERQVRAYNPVPGARFELDGELVKCWGSEVIEVSETGNGNDAAPGMIVAAGKAGVDVACGEGVLRLLQLQRAGRGRVSGAEFAAQLAL
ncbi:MAG: methionyl-tRNA formyltransferase, partial [Woeseia sp.]